jgi:hypothetical protein
MTKTTPATQVFLCQHGLEHWGKRVRVDGYEAYDATRGATVFGEAILNKALIVGRWVQISRKIFTATRNMLEIGGGYLLI